MRYILDAEFNGFGGPFISRALVPQDVESAPFYEALPCTHPEPRVRAHVLPVLNTRPVSRRAMIANLGEYLHADREPLIAGTTPQRNKIVSGGGCFLDK